MSSNRRRLLLLLSLLALVTVASWTIGMFFIADNPVAENLPSPNPVNIPEAWYEGAAGFEEADQLHRASHKAIIVYFYTDWCPYCKQLDSDLFPSPNVSAFLKSVIKVRINPENGERERGLAERFDVHGYPSVFVESETERPTKIYPLKRVGETWVLSGNAFIEDCRNAGAF